MTDIANIEFSPAPQDAVSLSFLLPYYRSQPIYWEKIRNLNEGDLPVSMLHPDVLALLYHFARYGEGEVLELGPYIGGSTITLAWGIKERASPPARIVSVEVGGSYYEHETMSSDNIIRDLENNLKRFGVAAQVDLIIGHSRSSTVLERVGELTREKGIGLMVVDADGQIAEDFAVYRSLLRLGAYLIVDDYYSPGHTVKVGPTKAGLSALTSQGAVKCLGVHGWGTWIGQVI